MHCHLGKRSTKLCTVAHSKVKEGISDATSSFCVKNATRDISTKRDLKKHPNDSAKLPRDFWTSESTHRTALEKFGREHLGVKELDDWYTVNASEIKKNLSFISNHYNGSLLKCLKTLYPSHDWKSFRSSKTRSYLSKCNDEDAQRAALERFGRERGFTSLDEWYSVHSSVVTKKLRFILTFYNGSLSAALKKLYPHYKWETNRFLRVPKGHWKDLNSQREALEKFGRERLGVVHLEDWYKITKNDVSRELSFIVSHYKGSLHRMLQKLYPQHEWDPTRFRRVPRNHWADEKTQREALSHYGTTHLGIKELTDWYNVTATNVSRALPFICTFYNGSLCLALQKLYPQHAWDVGKFKNAPQGFWKHPDTQKYYHELFKRWKSEFGIRSLRDWYGLLPPEQLRLFKKASMGIFRGTLKMLMSWFPEQIWKKEALFIPQLSQFELQGMLQHVLLDRSIQNKRADEVYLPLHRQQLQEEQKLVESREFIDDQWKHTWTQLSALLQ